MYQSLKELSNNVELTNEKIIEIINKLNSLGFEVDESIKKETKEERLVSILTTDNQFLLKIPANREDLFIEENFLNNFSCMFNISPLKRGKKLKQIYCDLIKLIYINNLKLPIQRKSSTSKNYLFLIKIFCKVENNFSPEWIQKKLKNKNLLPKKNVEDILELVFLEWGHRFHIEKNEKNFEISISYQEEKSSKNEKKAFLETFRYSTQRLISLIEIFNLGKISTIEVQKNEDKKILSTKKILILQKDLAKKILNEDFFNQKIFKNAGFKICLNTNNSIHLEISTMRRDITRQIDIVEEYARFFGLGNFQEIFPKNYFQINERKIENLKTHLLAQGFNEILTNPLIEAEKKLDYSQEKNVQLKNPLSNDFLVLRSTMLPKVFEIFVRNFRLSGNFKNFFETGHCFLKKDEKILEIEKLAVIFQVTEIKHEKLADSLIEWFRAKSILERLFSLTIGLEKISFEPSSSFPILFQTNRTVSIWLKKKRIGIFGEINGQMKKKLNSLYSTYIFEIDLDFLEFNSLKKNSFDNSLIFKRNPIFKKDLSFWINKSSSFLNLKKNLLELETRIQNISFFDLYINEEDKNADRISLTLKLEFFPWQAIEFLEDDLLKIKEFLKLNYFVEFR